MVSTIEIDEEHRLLTVVIEEDITVETAEDLDARLMRFLQDKFGFDLQLDLSRVHYMDSFGVGWLARLRQFVISRDGSIWFRNLSTTVRKTLQVTGFLPLFMRPT